jgi:predicted permease
VGTFLQDVRYGLRMLRAKPAFMWVAVLTLALGVGANTAIFSIVNAVLLRSLPFHDPGQLVRIRFNNPGVGVRNVPFSIPELNDLQTRSGVFEEVTPVVSGSVNLTGAKQPERHELLVTFPNYFSMLGAKPEIGRLFGPQDFALGFAPAVVISDGLWRREYGADPNVLGRSVRLDNDPYVIVGVLPPGFRHPARTLEHLDVEVWATAGFQADPAPKPERNTRILPMAIGRIKPGLSLGQAQAQLMAMAEQIRKDYAPDYPPEAQWTIEIQPLQEALVGDVRPMLLVLMGAVMLIVFIVSLNIANLLLARASGRQQEMAVRLALGATRGRMIRQLLTESVLLSLIGGTAGVLTAFVSLDFILRFVPASIPRLSEVRIDWMVLGFALLISLITGLLFGLAPAVQSTKADLAVRIREGGRGSAGYSSKTGRLRDALIVSELAFAVVLMVGAGLLLRTLGELLREDPGFNPTRVVTANLWLPLPNDPKVDPYSGPEKQTPFNREVLRRLNALPGVQLAAITSALPTTAQNNVNGLEIEDHPVESSQDLKAEVVQVSPDYFKVMQVPLVRGRFFSEGDENGKELVAIIDETTARHFWIDRDPIGRRLRAGNRGGAKWMTVVGIVKDVKNDGLDVNGVPHIYTSIYQFPNRQMSVVLRTALPATALETKIRQEIQSVDPELPVFGVSSMEAVIDDSLAPRRFSAELVGGFAGLAMLLASIGIYGLLAYMVGQRSQEIGLRMALGAGRADILKLILGRGAVLAAIGVVAGVLVSMTTASTMASVLYGVRPRDPAVFLAVPLLLLVVALMASYIPAWRATKLDPIIALRES